MSVKETEGVEHILAAMRDKGIRLWTDQGRLYYQTPRGSMTSGERAELQRRRGEIVEFLNGQSGPIETDLPSQTRLFCERTMPLTLSQSWMWKQGGKPTKRGSFLLRLMGPWQVPRLQAAFSAMLQRHDALRMEVSVCDDIPRLRVLDGDERQFEVVQFDQFPEEHRECAAKRFALEFRAEEAAVAGVSAFQARVMVMGAEDYVLLISWNHLFSDAISYSIFWNEFWSLYFYSADSPVISRRPLQFSEYVLRQEEMANVWLRTHKQFWKEMIDGAKVPRLRIGESPCVGTPSASEITCQFSAEFMERVRTASQQERTSVGMLLLAVLIVAIKQWCDDEEFVLCCATTGRTSPDLQSMIGLASSAIFVRVKVAGNDRFREVLRRVTEQYINGIRHDVAGGVLDQPPFSDLQRCVLFNYFPREICMDVAECFNLYRRESISAAISLRPLSWFDRDEEVLVRHVGDRELCFEIWESQGGATVRIAFRSDRLPQLSVARFLGSFESLLTSILADRSVRISSIAGS